MPFGIQCLNISPLHAGIFMPPHPSRMQLRGQNTLEKAQRNECNTPQHPVITL